MPRAKPNRRPTRRPPQQRRPPVAPTTAETVDPRWLIQAGAAVFAVGLLCAYISVCGFFYSQQWQFVLHPSRIVAKTPAAAGLSFQPVRFGVDAAGRPQLAGWWIPSDLSTDPTVLMLHAQTGSMSDALAAASLFHGARLNVLLFDYRGYGQSGGPHPTEQRMSSDAADALQYLAQTRGIPLSSIVVYGAGLGASLAVTLCERHAQIPALILQSADGDTESRVQRDERARIVPVGLLFHERFPLADALHTLRTPKLILSYTDGGAPLDAQRAADPKTTVEVPRDTSPAEITKVIRRFLGTYVQRQPGLLVP